METQYRIVKVKSDDTYIYFVEFKYPNSDTFVRLNDVPCIGIDTARKTLIEHYADELEYEEAEVVVEPISGAEYTLKSLIEGMFMFPIEDEEEDNTEGISEGISEDEVLTKQGLVEKLIRDGSISLFEGLLLLDDGKTCTEKKDSSPYTIGGQPYTITYNNP